MFILHNFICDKIVIFVCYLFWSLSTPYRSTYYCMFILLFWKIYFSIIGLFNSLNIHKSLVVTRIFQFEIITVSREIQYQIDKTFFYYICLYFDIVYFWKCWPPELTCKEIRIKFAKDSNEMWVVCECYLKTCCRVHSVVMFVFRTRFSNNLRNITVNFRII